MFGGGYLELFGLLSVTQLTSKLADFCPSERNAGYALFERTHLLVSRVAVILEKQFWFFRFSEIDLQPQHVIRYTSFECPNAAASTGMQAGWARAKVRSPQLLPELTDGIWTPMYLQGTPPSRWLEEASTSTLLGREEGRSMKK